MGGEGRVECALRLGKSDWGLETCRQHYWERRAKLVALGSLALAFWSGWWRPCPIWSPSSCMQAVTAPGGGRAKGHACFTASMLLWLGFG